MREPSREAREALCNALAPLYAEHRGVPDQGELWEFGSSALCGCSEGDLIRLWPDGREALARALDDFAEELRKELKTVKGASQAQRREVVRLGDMLRQWKKRYRDEQSRAGKLERELALALEPDPKPTSGNVVSRYFRAKEATRAAQQERDALRRRVGELEAEVERLRGVAGDALHDAAHNSLYRKIANDAATDWKARAERAEKALDEIAELDPEELGENDDEWGGAAVGARAQEIAEEARRGRGDG